MSNEPIKLIECPRDAMQGWKSFIPTQKKIEYINALLKVGFDTIDFGSFVSPKAMPQMVDTGVVAENISELAGETKLLAIVANQYGAEEACNYKQITYLGFPFSVSETFQLRNANSTIAASLGRVSDIQDLCVKNGKQLVVYISMGFGNPYGDPYSEELVFEWVNQLAGLDIGIISIADTVGIASAEQVYDVTKYLIDSFPATEVGVHLHAQPNNWKDKLEAALKAGCKRIDGALKGIGGCPMADDDLVGNMDSLQIIEYLKNQDRLPTLNEDALSKSLELANEIFAQNGMDDKY